MRGALRTIIRYVFLTPLLGLLGLAVLWVLGFISFLITIQTLNPMQPNTKTDGIVVLTGGADRVRTGLELLQHEQARELLISGVHRAADLKDLLLKAHLSTDNFPCCITLGFEADDTVGNARETANWVQDHHIKTLRLVTANYHMPRALIEMHRVLPDIKLIPHPVRPQGFNVFADRGWELSLSEYHKTILAGTRWLVALGRQQL